MIDITNINFTNKIIYTTRASIPKYGKQTGYESVGWGSSLVRGIFCLETFNTFSRTSVFGRQRVLWSAPDRHFDISPQKYVYNIYIYMIKWSQCCSSCVRVQRQTGSQHSKAFEALTDYAIQLHIQKCQWHKTCLVELFTCAVDNLASSDNSIKRANSAKLQDLHRTAWWSRSEGPRTGPVNTLWVRW